MSELYIGLMSGTSLDGIDAGLVDFSGTQPRLIAFHYQPFTAALRQRIAHISSPHHSISLADYGALDTELGSLFAAAVHALLQHTAYSPRQIRAIGSHGQTVFHAADGAWPFSLQIGDPNIIAQRTGISTVADFRRRDIAAGGQGAPLVPAFHQALFGTIAEQVAVVNIGGIANVTLLDGENTLGFDTGCGNTLMDYWCASHQQQPYDANGDWAASGQINAALLAQFKRDAYFQLPPPKSTGKEYFSPQWLAQQLREFPALPAADVQATLCQFTAETIADTILRYAPQTATTLVCGGGAHNQTLITALSAALQQPVISTEHYGVHPDHVEAMAFAWLARQTINHRAGNLCRVTGAQHPVILGGIYPGMLPV